MSIQRKAKALGYPKQININDTCQLAALVTWSEKEILNINKGASLEFLKDGSAKDWSVHLNEYAQKLYCPQTITTTEGKVDWILGKAVAQFYNKNKDEYNKFSVSNLKTSNVPNVTVDNVLDHIDFRSPEFQDGINKLAKILNVPHHNNPSVVLKACSTLIQQRLHKDAMNKPEDYVVKGVPYPYKEADPGFELKEEGLMEAAKVLRLLYISDLRTLQTKINECIVAVQSVTADPKTDTKLGQVGK